MRITEKIFYKCCCVTGNLCYTDLINNGTENEMDMINIVKARAAIGNILSGSGVPEEMQHTLQFAHDALLAYERTDTKAQAEAFAKLAGAREEWEIG